MACGCDKSGASGGAPSTDLGHDEDDGRIVIPDNYDDAILEVMCGRLDICSCQAELLLAARRTRLSDGDFERLLKWCCAMGNFNGGRKQPVPPAVNDKANECATTIRTYVCGNTGTVSAAAIALNALAAVNPAASAPAAAAASVLTGLIATCTSGGSLGKDDVAQLCGALNTMKPLLALMPASAQQVIAGLGACCSSATPGTTDGIPWWLRILMNAPGAGPGTFPGPGGLPIPWALPGTTPTPTPALPPGSSPPPQLPPAPPGVLTADWQRWLAQYFPYGGAPGADGVMTSAGNDPRASYGSFSGGNAAMESAALADVGAAAADSPFGNYSEQSSAEAGVRAVAETGGKYAGTAAGAAACSAGGPVAMAACGWVGGKIGGAIGTAVSDAFSAIF